jgi:hypothetical protein
MDKSVDHSDRAEILKPSALRKLKQETIRQALKQKIILP